MRRKVAMVHARGQITLPSEFREALGIGPDSLLGISLVDDHLEIAPLKAGTAQLRRYAEQEVIAFLEEDRLEDRTARQVRELLDRGAI